MLLLVVAAAFGTYYFQTVSTLNQMQTRDAYYHVHTLNFCPFEIVHNIPCAPACSGTLGVVSHSFVTTIIPSHVPLNPYISNFTTLYRITALGNSTGFYEQALPTFPCGRTPLVVGYKPSQVNATDFYAYHAFFLCQAFPFGISRTMVSGFSNIIFLNFPYP